MSTTPDSTNDDATAAAERLEQALERIAALAARPAASAEPGLADTATPEIADRLDQVIAKLRAGLGPDAA